jgi:hypothetical protein
MKTFLATVTALSVLALTADVRADCGSCGPKAPSAEKSAAASRDASKGCPVATAMERLPKLTYSVGQTETCCPKEAAKLAKESGGHIHYCVAGKEFDSKSDATKALIKATEKLVASCTKAETCPTSGQLTLAGQAQSCEKTAAKTSKLMQEAMAAVKMTYVVGEKECSCPAEARELAKESGKTMELVVGEQKTCCEQTARLNFARAKYQAAMKAMARASAKSAATTGT